MMQWIIIAGVAILVAVVRLGYDAWIYDRLYVDGLTPSQRGNADRYRTRAVFAMVAFLALEYAGRSLFASPLLDYAQAAALGFVFYFVVRASQRVSGLRTVASLLLVIAGLMVIVGAAGSGILPGVSGGTETLTVPGALAIVAAAGLFLAAAKLSRPEST